MPTVNGQEFPYTPQGMAQAEEAKKRQNGNLAGPVDVFSGMNGNQQPASVSGDLKRLREERRVLYRNLNTLRRAGRTGKEVTEISDRIGVIDSEFGNLQGKAVSQQQVPARQRMETPRSEMAQRGDPLRRAPRQEPAPMPPPTTAKPSAPPAPPAPPAGGPPPGGPPLGMPTSAPVGGPPPGGPPPGKAPAGPPPARPPSPGGPPGQLPTSTPPPTGGPGAGTPRRQKPRKPTAKASNATMQALGGGQY